jgi:hypothetical protein
VTKSKRTSLLLGLFIAILAPLWLHAQDSDAGKQDQKKAAQLLAKDPIYSLQDDSKSKNKLTPDEKTSVLRHVAFEESIIDEEITKAWVRVQEGATLEEINKALTNDSVLKRCDIVASRQNCVDKVVPPTIVWVPQLQETAPYGGLFKNNAYEIKETADKDDPDKAVDADVLKAEIDKVIAKVKTNKGHIVSMHVESSASTLRNGKDPKTGQFMTHEYLSRKRAESAVAFVKAYLETQQVPAPDDAKITMDYKGENGNGTSGPSSPFKCSGPDSKTYCPPGNGPPPSLEKMLAFLNEQAGSSVQSNQVGQGPEPAAAPAALGAANEFKSKTLDEMTPKGAGKGSAAPEAAQSCKAPPPPTVWDLYPAYYDQFKYVRISFVIDAPIERPTQGIPTKECTARAVLACVSTHQPTEPSKVRHRNRPHTWRRIGHFFKCLFDVKKDPCHPFSCGIF